MGLPACSLCGDEPTILVQGDAISGDQTFVGPSCLPGFMLTAAAELTKDQTPDWWEMYGSQLDQITQNDQRPDKPPAAGVRKPRAKKQPADAPEQPATGLTAVVLGPDDACPQCGGRQATGDDSKLTCDGCGNVLAVVPAATG